VNGNFNKEDAGFAAAIAALDDHVSSMIVAGQTAYRIQGEIRVTYQAGSSSVFQAKIDDWISAYNNVMIKFQDLGEKTSFVGQIIDAGENDAGVAGASWDSNDGIYDILAPVGSRRRRSPTTRPHCWGIRRAPCSIRTVGRCSTPMVHPCWSRPARRS
jgi:hypothetical protein